MKKTADRFPIRRKLEDHSVDCAEKMARQLTCSDHDKYDLLIGIDRANLRNMRRIRRGGFSGETHLLIYYTCHPGDAADLWLNGMSNARWFTT